MFWFSACNPHFSDMFLPFWSHRFSFSVACWSRSDFPVCDSDDDSVTVTLRLG